MEFGIENIPCLLWKKWKEKQQIEMNCPIRNEKKKTTNSWEYYKQIPSSK